jgi:four helix bundle protein
MEVGRNIAERLLRLATGTLEVVPRFPKDAGGRHVGSQLVRCVTGGGANYEEARAAESRDDFIHKAGIAAKEMRETVFWISLAQRARWVLSDLNPLALEAQELAAILGASVRTARRNRPTNS